ncbi:hypothetical protein, partial [Sansalvadorimonas verongulae]|uniref:hypothetical protein n=1 Tax=Sansalvadorimonas verongulae TaxID=2172824 RepID=UPI001E5DDBE3
AFVPGEIAGCGERFVTPVLVTGKRPVSCMDTFVGDEMTGCGENSVASVKVTGEEPFPCVDALVP